MSMNAHEWSIGISSYKEHIESIINSFDHSRWKRNAKQANKQTNKQTNKQRQKRARGTETIVKGWELNDFVVHLS